MISGNINRNFKDILRAKEERRLMLYGEPDWHVSLNQVRLRL